jgi:GNAT superfamily N-acetyltransferase
MANIRLAIETDAPIIAEFNQAMAMETEGKQLDSGTILAGVKRMITDQTLGFYLVGQVDDEVRGCLGITTEWSDWRNGLFWWIQSVYVAQEYRSHGVFSDLYKYVVKMAKEEPDVCGIRLYAERENEKALRTYFRLGMVETDYRILEESF